jgi:uncharacterized protein Yka (UPF0111/DUF47 family)
MGLFGNDSEQDSRLDAMEEWLHGLTGVVQQHKLDTTQLKLELKKLEAKVDKLQDQVGERLSEEDFDPAIMKISDGIAEARVMAAQAAEAAEEGWQKVQQAALDWIDELNASLDENS